ncbi:T9SS type B sorting domain-containing protein [Flavobacteriaceae bacterium SZ-1-7]|uniref:T9SS type B sorting domain-containing protein n=1 Tax=Tamlana sedimenti TaxID=3134126 RepID=UPI0031299FD2
MKNILSFLLLISSLNLSAQITLTHNVGNAPINTGMMNCEYEEYWARAFTLSEFGITTNEQFIIKSGQVAISNAYNGARVSFGILSIDDRFPNSSPISIGGETVVTKEIGSTPEIVEIVFQTPIVIPAGVEKILVVVSQDSDPYNPDYREFIIAGTEEDNDVSWFSGCREYYNYISTIDLADPVPNANFFINVTGEKFNNKSLGAVTTLTHNVCDVVVRTNFHSCSSAEQSWARLFDMEDFGISINEEFIVNSGQIGISSTGGGATITFNIYEVDENFPDSFSETNLLGSSETIQIPYISGSNDVTRIFTLNFSPPVVVAASVKKILVVSSVGRVWGDGVIFPGGSLQDNDVSWYKGCANVNGGRLYDFVTTESYGYPDARFYINVTGNVNHVTNNFEMNISNICSEFLKEFSVEKKEDVASVVWNFGDPASGVTNTSTDVSPFHDFSEDGIYTITATVKGINGITEVLTETIHVKEPPNAYGINNIYACEDNFATGFSSSFDVSTVQQQILGGQTDKLVTYIDGSGNTYNELPNPFANTVANTETITVRVAHTDNPCCYSEITFDLIVNPLPNLSEIADLIVCESQTNGFAFFDLQRVKDDLIGGNSGIDIVFFYENGQQIQEPLNTVENLVANEEIITVRATNTSTGCNNETTFKLKVNPLPIASPLTELVGCDDNNDGISEYFDTSNVEAEVLGNQTGMEVSFYNSNGDMLSGPLPNPFTNSKPNQEIITVRVTNPVTTCYVETSLVLNTAAQPRIGKPDSIYACDEGDGFGSFDTSLIESQLIGNQNGLSIFYFDANGNSLPSPLPINFKNSQSWIQTIYVRVENALNNLCYSETNFDLIVNELPFVNIDEKYFLCNLEPSMHLGFPEDFDTYNLEYQDGTVISNINKADLVEAGNYVLTVGEIKNGVQCENSFNFELIRSELPKITDVEYKELSDDNFIKIIASGDGDFEYSINGLDYKNDNLFENLIGGIYTAYVRDKKGCGEDSKKVVVIDYPKYFTPNGDGINDFWQIRGVSEFPNAQIRIYDRYGKLLKQIFAKNEGWDGTFNGKKMSAADYWFTVTLDDNYKFSGHFALKI